MTEVLVVGGGPAGLATALAAARRGFETRLVERAPTLGGMAASFSIDGIRVDHGSHRLHPVTPPRVRRLLDELLGDDLQVRERHGRLRLDGRWVGFPLRPVDLARSLRAPLAARAAADVALGPLRRAGEGSYAEVVRTGLGPTALQAFHGPMATKLWGLEPERLAAELARRRVPVRSTSGLVTKIARGTRSRGRTFLYPRLGFGQIVERLADAAVEAGATIETATEVRALRLGPDGPSAVVGSRSSRVDRVMWTAPTDALLRLVCPDAADRLTLHHRGLVLAYLSVATSVWSPFDAHYVPDADVAFSRLSEPRNYRCGPDPAGRTVLCAELPCSPGDPIWREGAAAAGDLVLEGMDRLGLPVPELDGVELRRLPSVYPVLTAADAGARRRLLDRADQLPGVTVVGRQGRQTGDNLHHVLEMALDAVDGLGRNGSWHARSWAAATDRFERFVVED